MAKRMAKHTEEIGRGATYSRCCCTHKESEDVAGRGRGTKGLMQNVNKRVVQGTRRHYRESEDLTVHLKSEDNFFS
jgi:hypothetical protein